MLGGVGTFVLFFDKCMQFFKIVIQTMKFVYKYCNVNLKTGKGGTFLR